ncbi:MAG: hypothetical protein ABI689_14670 [Thermoanaerobaculia bacterium]
MIAGHRRALRSLAAAASCGLLAALPVLSVMRRIFAAPNLIGPTGLDPFYVLYTLEWGARRWPHLLRGLWAAPFFYPTHHPLALSDHLILPAGVHAALRAVGLSPAQSYDLLLVLSFVLTAVAVAVLLRRSTRCSRPVATILALAVVYAPWRWGQITHLAMLWAPGPPLAILALDDLLRRPRLRRAAAFLAAFAITLLSGAYLLCFTGLALAVVTILRLARYRSRGRDLKRPLLLASAACAVLAMALTIYLPYRDTQRAVQAGRKIGEIRAFGAQATDWLAPAGVNFYARLVPQTWLRAEGALFPGILLAAGTAAWFFGRGRRRPTGLPSPLLSRALLASGLIFVALSTSTLFLFVSRALPGWSGMRVPTRSHFFVLLAAATASALALDRLGSGRSKVLRLLLAIGAGCLLLPDLIVPPADRGLGFEPPLIGRPTGLETRLAESDVHAVAIFPLGGDGTDIPRMWSSFTHGKPVANGYSGALPAEFRYLRASCAFPRHRIRPLCLQALRDLGIGHFAIEHAAPGAADLSLDQQLDTALRGDARQSVTLVYHDERALLFSVSTPAEEPEIEDPKMPDSRVTDPSPTL